MFHDIHLDVHLIHEGMLASFRPVTPTFSIFSSSSHQESYLTSEDHLRLAGEIIGVIGAIVLLFLKVSTEFKVYAKPCFYSFG